MFQIGNDRPRIGKGSWRRGGDFVSTMPHIAGLGAFRRKVIALANTYGTHCEQTDMRVCIVDRLLCSTRTRHC